MEHFANTKLLPKTKTFFSEIAIQRNQSFYSIHGYFSDTNDNL